MVSCSVAELFPLVYGSRAEAFVRLNHHEFGFLFYQTNGLALVQEEIVAYGAKTELRF